MFNISFIILRNLDSFVAEFGGTVSGHTVSFEGIDFNQMQAMESLVYSTRIGATKVKSRCK